MSLRRLPWCLSAYGLVLFCVVAPVGMQLAPAADLVRNDRELAEYFRAETAKIAQASLAEINTLEDWKSRRDEYRRQLQEMLGLYPWPEKTDLKPTITSKAEHPEFTVEKLHFQSRPGLYVTGNLYLPKDQSKPAPAILYVCGHSLIKQDGVSFGNKVGYQHHGAWFARHGYVCLTIDTLQLGEIEGIHHGTHRYNMWWWLNRGYTPAGVEAWNCIRALDYLQSRQEVDGQRIGVTGRSGGGAYSWWIAALDERIKVAVPVAGITDLQNYVVDGAVEGHCDCMFMLNTYRWDYPQVAALVAPRPLLIGNTDRDRIFPLDGVVRTYFQARRVYELYGAGESLGLNITSGPHKDTQELQVTAFRWFDKYLRGDERLIEKPAIKFFEPEQLRVFHKLPSNEQNTTIQESFVPEAAAPAVPASAEAWQTQVDAWRNELMKKTFRAWPNKPEPLDMKQVFSVERDGIRLAAWDFSSQAHVPLRLYVAHRAGLEKPELTVLNVVDDTGWNEFLATYRPGFEKELADQTLPEKDQESFNSHGQMFKSFAWAMAYVAPRGEGPAAWTGDERKQIQIRRRFMLLGQSLHGMQVWDVRRTIAALRTIDGAGSSPLWLQGHRQFAAVALYASLWEDGIVRLDLHQLPTTHRDGPFLLNVTRILEMPQVVAMAAQRSRVVIDQDGAAGWEYPQAVIKKLAWGDKQLQIRALPKNEKE